MGTLFVPASDKSRSFDSARCACFAQDDEGWGRMTLYPLKAKPGLNGAPRLSVGTVVPAFSLPQIAHLSDDKTVAKMGHPLWWQARCER